MPLMGERNICNAVISVMVFFKEVKENVFKTYRFL